MNVVDFVKSLAEDHIATSRDNLASHAAIGAAIESISETVNLHRDALIALKELTGLVRLLEKRVSEIERKLETKP